MKRLIFIFCSFIILTAMSGCSGKTDGVAQDKGNEDSIVTTIPEVTSIPEVTIEYKNSMTEAEKAKVLVEKAEFADKVTFYDEEIGASYVFDLLKSATFDSTKEAAFYVVMGSDFNDTQLKALCAYLDTNSTQTLIAVLNTDGVEDIGAMEDRDYVKGAQTFQTFLKDNLLGWFCENYKIDTQQVCIAGYEAAGYFSAYALQEGDSTANYLMISPELFKKTDSLSISDREGTFFTEGNKALSANVCVIRTQEDKFYRASMKTDEWIKSLKEHAYQGLVIDDEILQGVGHNTMDLEALLKGICYFTQKEYGENEVACVEASKVMTQKETDSIMVGALSKDHEFYEEVTTADPAAKEYIKEISMYDQEINDTFTIHLSLPEGYDKSKKYPLVLMTDGVWRLSDHPQLRQLMLSGEVEDVILVSVGYPNGYDYTKIRERDLVDQPDLFLQFLVENLMPYLCDNYSVDTKRVTLTGHSLGGYWGLYTLFHSDTIAKNTFNSYYIGSPSVQVNTDMAFAKNFEEWFYERKQSLDCEVYATVGGDEDAGFTTSIETFFEGMKAHNYEGLSFDYEVIKGYTHDTVFKPSIKNMMIKYYGIK